MFACIASFQNFFLKNAFGNFFNVSKFSSAVQKSFVEILRLVYYTYFFVNPQLMNMKNAEPKR